jgi:hypothetical protein
MRLPARKPQQLHATSHKINTWSRLLAAFVDRPPSRRFA